MNTAVPGPEPALGPATAAVRLASWGFLASPDLPDRPGPAHLLVAIRPKPTLRHFDPESVTFWVADAGRGRRVTIDGDTAMPLAIPFSWGPIRIVDRLGITNDYLTFGGQLSADRIDDAIVLVFVSPAPLLRRGGHSQPLDPGAAGIGAFLARILVPVGSVPDLEPRLSAAQPLVRYAAFVADFVARCRGHRELRIDDPSLWVLFRAEEMRLRRDHPEDWTAGEDLLAAMFQQRDASADGPRGSARS